MRWNSVMVVLVLASLSACRAPAWMPGDEPLAIYAPDDRAWKAVEEGCKRWEVATLECRRTQYSGEAAVHARIGRAPDGADATTDWFQSPSGDEFRVLLDAWMFDSDADDYRDYRNMVAAHEVGHLLGVWEHTDEPGTMMFHTADAPWPTDIDLEALAGVWGEAPWEDASE